MIVHAPELLILLPLVAGAVSLLARSLGLRGGRAETVVRALTLVV